MKKLMSKVMELINNETYCIETISFDRISEWASSEIGNGNILYKEVIAGTEVGVYAYPITMCDESCLFIGLSVEEERFQVVAALEMVAPHIQFEGIDFGLEAEECYSRYLKWKTNQGGFGYAKAFTHGGTFHSDDVMSSALLRILNPRIEIKRGFKPPEDDDIIVFDIGGEKFDHHQVDAEIRTDGTPYAAFGLLWREFGHLIVPEKYTGDVEELLVKPVDLTDNTGIQNPLSFCLSVFNSTWKGGDSNTAFEEAVSIAEKFIRKVMVNFNDRADAELLVDEAYESSSDKRIIVLPQFLPAIKYLAEKPEPAFVVFPSNRGGYNVQVIPKDDGTPRVPFPEEWLGNPVASMGMTFCHTGNFLCACGTEEEGVKIAQTAIERYTN